MRTRTLLFFAFVALLGAAFAVPSALAAPSEVKLEIAEHCYFAEWACWNIKGNDPEDIRQIQPFTIAQGGTISFEDNEARYPTDVLWKGTAPSCTSGVPVTPPTKTNWSGTCTFANPGDYDFESQELFNDGTFNYTKYEVVVVGPPTPTASTEQTTAVTETEATLNGGVNPDGQATSYYFEYGTTTAYGSKTTETPASSAGRVSAALIGLSPNTTYYVQLIAVYGADKTKVEGGSMTFKTAAPPPTKEPTAKEPAKEPATKEPSPTSSASTAAGNPATTTSSSPSSGQPQAEPVAGGPLFGSVELASSPRGGAVHGSLLVSSIGSAGRLRIELLTKGAAAAVGQLVRSSLHAGKLTFVLALNAKGKAALRRRRRLTLAVKITLTPVHGAAMTITRGVVIRA